MSRSESLKRSASSQSQQQQTQPLLGGSFAGKLESTATTELNKSVYTFYWRISNFDIICPADCDEFEMLKSPLFIVAEEIGKRSEWFIHVSGVSKHVACYLQLHSTAPEVNGMGRNARQQTITCSYKMSLGNEEDHFCFNRCINAHKFTRENNDWGYAKFISIAELYEKKDALLVGQTLCICVKMEIYGDPINVVTTLPVKRMKSETITETFFQDFQELLNSKKHADVEIACGERTFHAHKLVLSARSKVFRAMFDSQMQESSTSRVVLLDIDGDTIDAVLTYIYTGKVVVPESTSYTELIYGAEKYDLPQLKNYCFDKMIECVSSDTIGALAVAAYTYNADPEYKEAIKTYCQTHISTLQRNPTFKKLMVSHPRAFWDD